MMVSFCYHCGHWIMTDIFQELYLLEMWLWSTSSFHHLLFCIACSPSLMDVVFQIFQHHWLVFSSVVFCSAFDSDNSLFCELSLSWFVSFLLSFSFNVFHAFDGFNIWSFWCLCNFLNSLSSSWLSVNSSPDWRTWLGETRTKTPLCRIRTIFHMTYYCARTLPPTVRQFTFIKCFWSWLKWNTVTFICSNPRFEREAPVFKGQLPFCFCLKSPVFEIILTLISDMHEFFKSITLTNSMWKS